MACGKALIASLMLFILICHSVEGTYYPVLTNPFIMRGCPKVWDCPGDYITSRCRSYQIFTTADGTRCRCCPENVCADSVSITPAF